MAMTEGISVEGLEDSGNNLFAVVSKVAEIIGMCCRGRLESVCACTKGRREEDCDGMGASFYGRRQTWALAPGTRPAGFSLSPNLTSLRIVCPLIPAKEPM
jgi:hypothetical protein